MTSEITVAPPATTAGILSAEHVGATVEIEVDGRMVLGEVRTIEHRVTLGSARPQVVVAITTVPSRSTFVARVAPEAAVIVHGGRGLS